MSHPASQEKLTSSGIDFAQMFAAVKRQPSYQVGHWKLTTSRCPLLNNSPICRPTKPRSRHRPKPHCYQLRKCALICPHLVQFLCKPATVAYTQCAKVVAGCLVWHQGPLASLLHGGSLLGTMLFTEHTMPDDQIRVYCMRISSVVAYFCDDGEGGSVLIVEPSDYAAVAKETLDQVRFNVLEEAGTRLHCPPHCVERRSIGSLCKIVDLPDPPRHPWQFKSRGKVKAFAR